MKSASLLFLFSAVGFAQSTSTATLSGTVTDTSTGAVVGATVRITNEDTQFGRRITTDDAGFYRFDLLPPGTYDLRVELKGFAPGIVTGLPLQVGTAGTQNVVLEVAGATNAVVVMAEA